MKNSVPRKKTSVARNLPVTICQSRMGAVSNNSRVPSFCSSARSRMVMRGASSTRIEVLGTRKPLIPASGRTDPKMPVTK